jgi:hypothetical protein
MGDSFSRQTLRLGGDCRTEMIIYIVINQMAG